MTHLIKADLHMHTCYSPDCTTSLGAIINRCLNLGIDCIAITDHNTIAGGLEMQKKAPFTVIVSEEIRTTHGEIIGFFLARRYPAASPLKKLLVASKHKGGWCASLTPSTVFGARP